MATTLGNQNSCTRIWFQPKRKPFARLTLRRHIQKGFVTLSTQGAYTTEQSHSSLPHADHSSHVTSSSSAPNTASIPNSDDAPVISATNGSFQIQSIHLVLFALIFIGGAFFATMTLQFTTNVNFHVAVSTVARRVAKSVAFRQLIVIAVAISLVRFGLNQIFSVLSKFASTPIQWEKSKMYYILKEVYQPLELLLFVAALCTIADSFLPQLISIPKATVSHVVKSTLSISFIVGAAVVVFNLKSRFCQENAWQCEMKGDVTSQRRWEAYDKLGTFVVYVITFVFGIQAIGLEVTSVLAIGGIGGLAIGLAGREICENLLNGFLIMSTNPFLVGDEVTFVQGSKNVEGIVTDIGWYRTLIRSFEREVFVIPNAVFSKNIVLNVSRKLREFRFLETINIRVVDVNKANDIIGDIRRIVRNDSRVITKLHRRIFLEKITREDVRIYVSFYLDCANREAFMAVKQDLLLAFVDCVERNGAKLAQPRVLLAVEDDHAASLSTIAPVLAAVMYSTAAATSAAAAANSASTSQDETVDVLSLSDTSSASTFAQTAAANSAAATVPAGNGTSAQDQERKPGQTPERAKDGGSVPLIVTSPTSTGLRHLQGYEGPGSGGVPLLGGLASNVVGAPPGVSSIPRPLQGSDVSVTRAQLSSAGPMNIVVAHFEDV